MRSPLRGSGQFFNATQGSQGLALGLALAAAPRLRTIFQRNPRLARRRLGLSSGRRYAVPDNFQRNPSSGRCFAAR